MGLRRSPYAFTEQGVAMLSSVLKSKRAIAVNIAIMRTFVRLRQPIQTAGGEFASLRPKRYACGPTGEIGERGKEAAARILAELNA